MSTDLERRPNVADIATATDAELADLEAALSAEKRTALQDERISLPRLDLVQGTTKKPPANAKPGNFFNTLSGDVFGDEVVFLVAHYARGRFYPEKDAKGKRTGRTFAAGPEAIVPSNWPEQFAGKVFAELAEAEERFSELANAGDIEWGDGPPIQTTYNFTGVVVEPQIEGAEPFPVRLSLSRTGTGAAKKLISLIKPLPNYWTRTIQLKSERKVNAAGEPYFSVVTEAYGEPPEPKFRKQAIELALAAEQVGFKSADDDPDKPAPAAAPGEDEPAPSAGAKDGPDF